MTYAEVRLSLIYAALLIVLAYMGTVNQGFTRRHVAFVEQIQHLSDSITHSRARTATVTAPEAVIGRAHKRGMIPATEGKEIVYTSPIPAPEFPLQPSGLEMRTLWR
jgi:alpha-D-ribose 1-methylphosphonate 5-phosphate C-P lyase